MWWLLKKKLEQGKAFPAHHLASVLHLKGMIRQMKIGNGIYYVARCHTESEIPCKMFVKCAVAAASAVHVIAFDSFARGCWLQLMSSLTHTHTHYAYSKLGRLNRFEWGSAPLLRWHTYYYTSTTANGCQVGEMLLNDRSPVRALALVPHITSAQFSLFCAL